MTQQFVHLHLHSAYSLAEGAIKIPDLVSLCQKNKMPAVAVTDTNNMFGALEFAIYAKKAGLQSIIGCQVMLAGNEKEHLVLLAQNEAGYRNLCQIISDAYMHGGDQAEVSIDIDALPALSEGIICLSGGSHGPIAHCYIHEQDEQAEEIAHKLKTTFGDRFYIELQRHGWRNEQACEGKLIDLAYRLEIPLVATNDCYFAQSKMYEAHDALLCIADGRYISETDRRKVTPQHYFKSAQEMGALFSDLPEAIDNTIVIAKRCSFLLETMDPILPPFETEGGRSEVEELEAQAKEGLQWRLEKFVYPEIEGGFDKEQIAKPYIERLAFELEVINNMGFPGYFLICSDFIVWAKEHDIPVGPGRGSGAGSVVAWSLKITDLDPLRFNLLFERFLNPERVSMPDFDIDFCQERREEVINYVQKRYGYDHVAQIITFGKLQARAVVRDVGRVLQMPYGQVDRIAKMIPNNPAAPMTLGEALEADPDLRLQRNRDETSNNLITIALQLEGLFRHASTHAAGVVIGDRSLHELVPLYRDPRSEMPVTQFNMKYVEQAGLVKFDFLGLKTMTVIQKTVELLKHRRVEIDILQVPLNDTKTYKMMGAGHTVGVFQLESAGMRDVLRKMNPDRFEDIIALVALYRPGPMDNIPQYISVKLGHEQPDYLHPKLQPFLEETYGIMIYQEQVMQAAQELAGYTLGAADLLRRAMGKKIQAEMDAQRQMFVDGAKEHNDVPAKQASDIFDQIAKFAGYGFNKSHAAAYALIAYWTGYLKANHPVEFMAASMTMDMGNTEKLAVFKQDLDRMEVALLPPDINKSYPIFSVEGASVRYGLAALKSVGEQAMELIVKERNDNGEYKSLDDLSGRLDPKAMNKRQFEMLSSAGAFECLDKSRARVHGGAELLLRHAQSQREEKDSGQVNLFGSDEDALGLPEFPLAAEWDPLEKLAREFAAVGFYLSAHPLDTRAEQLERMGISTISKIERRLLNAPKVRAQMAGVLLKKQERVAQKSGNKYAFLQLSDASGIFEVMVFSDLLAATREFLEAGETLLLTVEAEQRDEQLRFTTQKIERLDVALEHKIRGVKIYMDSADILPKLKELIDAEGRGMARVELFMHTNENQIIEMHLPGRWKMSAESRNIIRTIEGVRSVSEV